MSWWYKFRTKVYPKTFDTPQVSVKNVRKTYVDDDCMQLIAKHDHVISVLNLRFIEHIQGYLVNQAIVSSTFTMIKQNGIVGIAYHPKANVGTDEYRAYLFQLKERHKQIGYVQKLALHEVRNGAEIISYYLKPSMRLQNTVPAEQIYGNVTLEIKLRNGHIQHLKCMTTYYSDSNYKDVRPWDEWYHVIFLGERFDL